ncbi:hypothetical protein M569_03251, partial [Genlisea aurea]
PLYYRGLYHLFYQYNPRGAVWGNNIVWAHSVSEDLINWKRLDPAIYPSKPFDRYGCWSGSATVLPGNKPVILYTGIVDENNTQVQNYAVPANLSDPFLREWIKPRSANPLITPDGSVNATAFRDPTTAWKGKDGRWRISLGGRWHNTGIVFLYSSRDFKHWIKEKPLHTVSGTGNFECPDFYPVSVSGKFGLDTSAVGPEIKHVLKVSLDVTRYEYYTIGSYAHEENEYRPDEGMVDGWNGLRYDYGNFYASKSFYDPVKKRRILWGWANESDSTADDVKKGWAGIQLIPRTILLDPSGKQLLQWPVEEVESLRGRKKVEIKRRELAKGSRIEIEGITAAQADVDVTFSFDGLEKSELFDPKWNAHDAQSVCGRRDSTVEGGLGPFGLVTLASENMEEFTPVFFRVFKHDNDNRHLILMCSDASRSSLKKEVGAYRPSFAGFLDVDLSKKKKLSLRSLIDNSVVESFGERGKTCISSRVYPTLAIRDNARLYAFNNGSETIKIERLEAWSMNKPHQMNN